MLLIVYLALVDVDLAPGPGETGQTDAGIGGDAVDARAVVLARARLALVDVDVAILACVQANQTSCLLIKCSIE